MYINPVIAQDIVQLRHDDLLREAARIRLAQSIRRPTRHWSITLPRRPRIIGGEAQPHVQLDPALRNL